MKLDLKQMVSEEGWRRLERGVKKKVHLAVKCLLIQHGHALDVTAVALVLVLAAYLVTVLLYLDPPGVSAAPAEQLELTTDAIDRLELWIEQRDASLAKEMVLPERAL